MSIPTATLEIAFASAPLATPVWTDVSDYLISGSVQRGRQRELDRIETGQATLLLDNSDRRFDPTNTAGPYWPNVLPERRARLRATYNSVSYDVCTMFVERWPLEWMMPGYSQVQIVLSDGFDLLAAVDIEAGASPVVWPEELSGARVARVLDAAGWPAADRLLDAGQSLIQSTTIAAGATVNALAHLQDVADSEMGVLFVDGSGRVVFHDRHHRLRPASVYASLGTFGDQGDELPYEDLVPDYDRDRIVNHAVVAPSGVTAGSFTDSSSVTSFGRRSHTRSPLLSSATDAQALAEWIVGVRKDPQLRFDRMVLLPSSLA